ncbi:MAG: hypothetical protein K0U86_01760 [Planctomycetes bacterium]|nr:hypothetical protein [Planctomycetota bacterium]MCH9723612.1 hypothetical protein [Planctomycetota bacterium]MCH9778430.1 hypothetical protein [Planctomycetota bacterium]MCH9791812.1 hypothetical protein [Planctomycetota bacterium]
MSKLPLLTSTALATVFLSPMSYQPFALSCSLTLKIPELEKCQDEQLQYTFNSP